MIHKFNMNGINIVLDVESGCSHIVDDVAYRLLEFIDSEDLKTGELNFEKISSDLLGYGREVLEEVFQELVSLYNDGSLWSEANYPENISCFRENAPVKALCLNVSHDCNLKCSYCFAGKDDYLNEKTVMDEKVAFAAIDFVIEKSASRRNIEVDFFGGEPLMNFNVVKKTIDYARSLEKKHNKNFRFTITTNGVLLNDEIIDYINENMSNAVLSLDGRPEVHDGMRKSKCGGGSYDTVVNNFVKLAKLRKDKDFYVRGTFTSQNLDFTNDVLHIYNLGFKSISIEPVVSSCDTSYALREEHLPDIYREYERLALECLDKDFSFFHFMIDVDGGPCAIKRIAGCGAGCEYLCITPGGDIYPCHQFVGKKELKMGNILKGDYDTKTRDRFLCVNVLKKDDCSSCWAKYYCSGGCHANAYEFTGSISDVHGFSCGLMKKRVECALFIKAALCEKQSEPLRRHECDLSPV